MHASTIGMSDAFILQVHWTHSGCLYSLGCGRPLTCGGHFRTCVVHALFHMQISKGLLSDAAVFV